MEVKIPTRIGSPSSYILGFFFFTFFMVQKHKKDSTLFVTQRIEPIDLLMPIIVTDSWECQQSEPTPKVTLWHKGAVGGYVNPANSGSEIKGHLEPLIHIQCSFATRLIVPLGNLKATVLPCSLHSRRIFNSYLRRLLLPAFRNVSASLFIIAVETLSRT